MLKTVKVPKEFEPIFEKAQEFVSRYFQDRKENIEEGTIQIFGQRYIYVRAASMSVEFFELIKNTYRDKSEDEALAVARSLLFDVAHAIGVADAKNFHTQLHLKDPIEKLSAGPVHFAHAGWAFVDIHPESRPSPDEEFYLVYDHPYSFESDSWLQAKKSVDFPVCIMNAGYSSGWCEESFGVKLVATEILCKAKGDDHCRFIMAHPNHIEARIQSYLKTNKQIAKKVSTYEIPGFFSRKRAEDELRKTLDELERRVEERTNELQHANEQLLKEIEERKKVEAALRESEERYRQFIAYSAEGIYRVELRQPVSIALPEDEQIQLFFKHAFIAECNLSMAHMYGFETQEEAIGVPISQLLLPSDPHNVEYMRKFIHGGYRYFDQESHEVDKFGRPKYFLNNATGFIENGYLMQVWGTQRDITERRLAEEALARSEQYYRSLIEHSTDIVTILDVEGKILYESPSIEKVLGYGVSELVGNNAFEFVHSDDVERIKRLFISLSKIPNTTVTIEYRFRHQDGSWRMMESTGRNLLHEPGVNGIVVNSRDVTERRKAAEELQHNQASLLAIIENTKDSIWSLDANYRIVTINSTFKKSFQLAFDIILEPGMHVLEVIPEDLRGTWQERYDRVLLKGESFTVSDHFEYAGKSQDVDVSFNPIITNDGKITGASVFARDVTERKRIEAAVTRSERYYRALIENALDIITILNVDGTVRYESPSIARIFGFSPDELVGRHITEFVHPDDRERLIETFRQGAASERKVVNEEFRFIHKDGSWRVLEVTGHNMLKDPVVAGIVVNSRDITLRKKAEQALLESEQQYRALVEQSSNPVYVLQHNKVVLVNAAWEELFGYKREEVLNEKFDYMTLIAPESWEVVRERMERRMKGLPVVPKYEMQALTKDGRHVYIDVSVAEITWHNKPAVQGVYYDITQRKRAEAALAAEKEQLAVTLRSIGDGVITTDILGRIVLLNKVAEQLTGWSSDDALGKPIETVFNIVREKTGERVDNPVYGVLKSGSPKELKDHTALIAKDGMQRLISDSAAPILDSENHVIGAVLVFRDITERNKLEQERIKASKLESVGILAGGIAHDFNNILTAILGNLSLMKMVIDKPDEIRKRVNEAEKASMRARDLTQQLLTFSKGGAPVKSAGSIRELIKDSSEFALRGSNISCHYSIASGLWPVEVDQGQISQVIHNLILNAVQAMPEGGKIDVSACNLRVTPAMGLPLQEGTYLQIAITDHGIGIPPEHLQKIFDPYFTTKQKGSGLGLATSYSIIKNHDGFIAVQSELGKQTTFTVYLPAIEREIEVELVRPETELSGAGKILIMDDEEDIRNIMTQMLRRLGYVIVATSDGREAIDCYTQAKLSEEPFDLVVMDLTIPGGMGGKEAMERLRKFDPDIKAIVISGYSNDPVMSDFRNYGFSGVIPKPFDMATLTKTIKEMLIPAV